MVDLSYDSSDDDADATPRAEAAEVGARAAVPAAGEGGEAAAAERQEEQADPHLLACPYFLSHVGVAIAIVVVAFVLWFWDRRSSTFFFL